MAATTATLLDEAGVRIKKIQDLLGHRDIRVTQTYIKLGNDTRKSGSHEVPLQFCGRVRTGPPYRGPR